MRAAERINSLRPYFFASLHQRIAALTASGRDIIRLDMGSPDLPPADFIVAAMQRSAAQADHHGYTTHRINHEYREAASGYYGRRFGVELDAEAEVLGLIGSKEGIFNLTMAMVNPGDVVLVPDPGYPVYRNAAQIAGGEVVTMPLREENGFLPDLPAIPEHILARTAILWLNYPNNPTTAFAPPEIFTQAVALAARYGFLICHDAPYMDITYDGREAISILQIPGAKEVAVEFNSLSKTFNMGGWRLGMAVGNTAALRALSTLKSNIDSGHFQPMLEGGIAALTGDQTWIKARNAVYRERRDIVLEGLRRAGLNARPPEGTIYVWAKIPQWRVGPLARPDGQTSADFTSRLLEEASVSLTPGTAFGEHGEGYVRISLGLETGRVKEAMERIAPWSEEL